VITYILPTRDRPERLALTLAALGSLRGHPEAAPGRPEAEVIVVDNASRFPPVLPERLANGLAVRVILRRENEGAASRNIGVREADPRSSWVVMLDDDSYPVDTGFIRRLMKAPREVGAVSADIYLPGLARRESGGLPEVFIGCGVALRREAFLELGGYDAGFNYYAEEYDLAARMIMAGLRVEFDPWFRVEHHKVASGRDMDTILSRLVRNNGWVMQRYAPEALRRGQIREQRRRYRAIALKEGAVRGFGRGLVELRGTIRGQRRSPMSREQFDRFTGVSHAREAFAAAQRQRPLRRVAIVDEGKNGWVVRRALAELGVEVVAAEGRGDAEGGARRDGAADRGIDAVVIGTMSPGPMLDAFERRTLGPGPARPVLAPWLAVMNRPGISPDILTGGRAA
jgi:GT2 family glycosyltransferase